MSDIRPRGECQACRRRYRVTGGGVMYHHWIGGGDETCPGSAEEPMPGTVAVAVAPADDGLTCPWWTWDLLYILAIIVAFAGGLYWGTML